MAPASLLAAYVNLFWDTNGSTNGLGTVPRVGDWSTAVTNWSATDAGNVATTNWPGNDWPTPQENAVFRTTSAVQAAPGAYTLASPGAVVTVVGTQIVATVHATHGFAVILTNGAVRTQIGSPIACGAMTPHNTMLFCSDLQLGPLLTANPVVNQYYALECGRAALPISANATNNTLILAGKVYSTTTNTVTLVFSTVNMNNRIVLPAGSEISNGASAALQVITGVNDTDAAVAARVEFYGTNAYTGTTQNRGGTMVAYADAPHNQNGAFGKSTVAVILGANNTTPSNKVELLTGAAGVTIGRAVQVWYGSGSNMTFGVFIGGEHTNGLSTYSGDLTLATTYARTTDVHVVAAAGGTVRFSGNIVDGVAAGGAPINKKGLGTVELSGNNTYRGGTKVTQGTVLANGTLGGTGAVVVASSGTLGGKGTISGLVTVQAGGCLAPGTNAIGTLTVSNVTFAADSSYRWEGSSTTGDLVRALGAVILPTAMTVTVSRVDGSELAGSAVLIDSAMAITGGDPAKFTLVPAKYFLRLSTDGKQLLLRPNLKGTMIRVL